MPALYIIQFLPSGRTEKVCGPRGNYYEFPDGVRLDLHSIPVWCRRCGRITHGEDLDRVEVIDRQIADAMRLAEEVRQELAAGCGVDPHAEGAAYFLKQADSLRRRREWRLSRASPPKCILCGSTDIVVPEMDKAFPHPAGAGQIRITIAGFCSNAFNEWFFTPEGDRIPRDPPPRQRPFGVID